MFTLKPATIKRYFIAGLLIWIPLVITVWVLSFIISVMDQSLLLLPEQLRPLKLLGFNIPGLGTLLTLLIIFVSGVFAANFLGQKFVNSWEQMLARIPVVNSIYNGVKQVSETILAPNSNAFRKALLVQYPRQGCWVIAFLTGKPGGDTARHLGSDYISIYVPTTPNPTSGFFIMVKAEETKELDMSVDDALKYIISMGVVPPVSRLGHDSHAIDSAADETGATEKSPEPPGSTAIGATRQQDSPSSLLPGNS
ncbi:MAG: DUF502 domain-containing protein [Betaproteobacteria bacterium]|nr:DUF502 domain-containing protein [Betaproteobacteria bacterium]